MEKSVAFCRNGSDGGGAVVLASVILLVVVVVAVDLLERLPDQSADPDGHIGRKAMHQSESSDGFEFVNVQLDKY